MLIIKHQRERTLSTIYNALMMEPIERAMAREINLTRQGFMAGMVEADVLGFVIDGELAGGAFFNQGRIHIAVLPRFKGRWARGLKRVMDYGFKRHGSPLVARVQRDNAQAVKFVEAVGCVLKEESDKCFVFICTPERMRYRKARGN